MKGKWSCVINSVQEMLIAQGGKWSRETYPLILCYQVQEVEQEIQARKGEVEP